jgi:hypothetical protein
MLACISYLLPACPVIGSWNFTISGIIWKGTTRPALCCLLHFVIPRFKWTRRFIAVLAKALMWAACPSSHPAFCRTRCKVVLSLFISFEFSGQNFMSVSRFLHACSIFCTSISSWCNKPKIRKYETREALSSLQTSGSSSGGNSVFPRSWAPPWRGPHCYHCFLRCARPSRSLFCYGYPLSSFLLTESEL